MAASNRVYMIVAPPWPGLPGRIVEEINNVRGLREKGPHACVYLEESGYVAPWRGSGFNEPGSIGEVVVRQDKRPFRDFEFLKEYFILSERALRLFEHIAPDVVASKKVEMHERGRGRREDIGDYYACDVVQFLDAIDETRPGLQWLVPGKLYESPFNFAVRSDALGDQQVFRLLKAPGHIYCTDETRLRFKQEKMKGVRFVDVGEIV